MFIVLAGSFSIYSGINLCDNSPLGYLTMSSDQKIVEVLNPDGTKGVSEIVCTDIPLKREFTSNSGELDIKKYLVNNAYFALITFTTIGYGDIKPVGGFIQIVAGLEGLSGVLLMSLFLVTAAKKVLW